MRGNKKVRYSLHDEVAYRMTMGKMGISKYKHIGTIRKVCGWALLGYGVVGVDLGLSMVVGALLLGIPLERIKDLNKLWFGKAWYCVCVLCSKKRVYSELRLLKMRVFK